MKNNTRKIVVLDGLKSTRIEQAIFILRDEQTISESDAVTEAERIVSTYLETLSQPVCKSNKKKFPPGFLFGAIAYTITTMVLTAYFIAKFNLVK